MKHKRIVLIILALVLLAAVLGSCAPKDDTKTSDLKISKSNLVEPDGWVYYRTNDGLFKIKPDGTDKTLVLSTIPSMYQIYEGRIYYMPYDERDRMYKSEEGHMEYYYYIYNIYSCNTDGSDIELICETPRAVSSGGKKQMGVVDGWIYLGLECDDDTGFDLYRINIDGTGTSLISPADELFWDYSVDNDGWIYYMTYGEFEDRVGGQLWRMHYDGREKQQLMQEISWAIDYTETEIFYIDMSENNFYGDIYAVSRKGTEKRKVAECEAQSTFSLLKVIGDWVYYVEIGDNFGFYKVRTDGSELTEIPAILPGSSKISVVDNWLIYSSDDNKYIEMIRISDMYDTDALFDLIRADQLESTLSMLDPDDPLDKARAEKYQEVEVRKYE